MDTEIIFMVEDSADGGYKARGLGYPIFTEAATVERLRQSVRDAVRRHFQGGELPRLIRLHYVRDEVIAV